MKPLNINKSSCTEISSNCVVWNGPDLQCINLCKGDTITQVMYEIATKLCALVEELNVDNYDISCLDATACPPKTFNELMNILIEYICNIEAQNGADGRDGNYTEVTAFAPGLNGCVNGGFAITTFDGETSTQLTQYFICNPIDGENGVRGPQGPRGDYTIITPAGSCPDGGYTISLYNGVGDALISQSTVCNGADGAPGQSIDHTSFTSATGSPSTTPNKPGETDTYTVWGDVGETINLGTFDVYNGDNGETPCCNFTVRIIQNETSSPEEPLFSAVVTPSTPGVTYEWQTASFNDSIGIVGSTTSDSILVDFVNPAITLGSGADVFMETFRVIVRSEDGCCVADAYFNALSTSTIAS